MKKLFKATRCCLESTLIMLSLLSYTGATAQWQKLQRDSVLFGNYYSSIQFVSDSVGFLVGCSGYSSWDGIGLFKTKNAGASWSYIQGTSGGDDCRIPNSFVNENSGYSILSHGTLQPNDLMKTNNGGAVWNNLMSTSGLYLGDISFNGAIYFIDDMLGFIAKDDTLYRTSTGGTTWQPVSSGHLIKTIFFTSLQTGYAAGDNIVLKTTDGGSTWQVVETKYTILSVSFSSANIGYATGMNGIIIKTVDAGNTWFPQFSGLPHTMTLNSIFAVNDNTCFAVGDDGTILHTSNGGSSWVSQNSGVTVKLNSISCTQTDCYVVGDTSVILKAANGATGLHATEEKDSPIEIFPNPFSEEATIKIKNIAITHIIVTNAAGQEFEMSYSKSGQEIKIHRENLPAGLYFLHLVQDNGIILSGKTMITE